MDVGAALREARERRALSVDDLARITRIKAANLLAIETNRRDDLPDDVYLRGFVRAYAREVGLDPDDIARRYFEQFAPPPEVSPAASQTADAARTAYAQAATEGDERHGVRDHWVAAAILIVIAVFGYRALTLGTWPASLFSQARPAIATTAAPAPAATPASARTETGTTGSGDVKPAGMPDDGLLHVAIHADGWCWVTAIADGTRVLYSLMQPGEEHTLDVRQDAVLRIGDPAAFRFTINGAAGRPLGPAGVPVTAHITAANYRDYLRP